MSNFVMNDEQEKPKRSWFKLVLFVLIVLVIISLLVHSKSHWLPRFQKANAVAVLSPMEQMQQEVANLALQVTQLQEGQIQLSQTLQKRLAENSIWRLSDASYLIHLADYQSLVNYNVDLVIKLLNRADQDLSALNNPSVQSLRELIAKNILQLKTVPAVDVGGIIARLNAVSAQISNLQVAQPAPIDAQVAPDHSQDSAWKHFLHAIGHALRNLIVIRHLDQPLEPLLKADQQVNLNQHMIALLQQAQWAVLQRNAAVYRSSLQTSQALLNQYIMLNQVQTKVLQTELEQLAGLNIAPPFPDLSQTVIAIDTLKKHYHHSFQESFKDK